MNHSTQCDITNVTKLFETRCKHQLSDIHALNIGVSISCIVFLHITVFAGLFGNTLVFLAVRRSKVLKTAMNALLVNLAIIDTVASVLATPLRIVILILTANFQGLARGICFIHEFISILVCTVQLTTLVAISYERFQAIANPFDVENRVLRVRMGIIFSWGIGFIMSILVVIFLADSPSFLRCTYVYYDMDSYQNMYSNVVLAPISVLATFIILTLYGKIIMALRRHTATTNKLLTGKKNKVKPEPSNSDFATSLIQKIEPVSNSCDKRGGRRSFSDSNKKDCKDTPRINTNVIAIKPVEIPVESNNTAKHLEINTITSAEGDSLNKSSDPNITEGYKSNIEYKQNVVKRGKVNTGEDTLYDKGLAPDKQDDTDQETTPSNSKENDTFTLKKSIGAASLVQAVNNDKSVNTGIEVITKNDGTCIPSGRVEGSVGCHLNEYGLTVQSEKNTKSAFKDKGEKEEETVTVPSRKPGDTSTLESVNERKSATSKSENTQTDTVQSRPASKLEHKPNDTVPFRTPKYAEDTVSFRPKKQISVLSANMNNGADETVAFRPKHRQQDVDTVAFNGRSIKVVDFEGRESEAQATDEHVIGAVCVMTNKNKERGKRKLEGKAAKRASVVIGSFLFIWLPLPVTYMVTCNLTSRFDARFAVNAAELTALSLASFTAAINPILYAIVNRQFKNEFVKILKKIPCLEKHL
ncbi:uncharacterized protein LOC141901184 [Tubulanus polymorphus]|uniref:uncharacterized protein LOC141901184 n=1 Tax=Tubulanus polymorphus TaxID=672921 RepID=UPI003DA1EFEE